MLGMYTRTTESEFLENGDSVFFQETEPLLLFVVSNFPGGSLLAPGSTRADQENLETQIPVGFPKINKAKYFLFSYQVIL